MKGIGFLAVIASLVGGGQLWLKTEAFGHVRPVIRSQIEGLRELSIDTIKIERHNPTQPSVAVKGQLPDGCYASPVLEIQHVDAFLHEIKVLARRSGVICSERAVPFEIHRVIGELEEGQHVIRMPSQHGGHLVRVINVRKNNQRTGAFTAKANLKELPQVTVSGVF